MCGANSGPKSWFDVLSSSNLFNPFFPLELILWKPRKCLPHLWPIEIKQITQNRQKLLSNHVSKVYFQRERERERERVQCLVGQCVPLTVTVVGFRKYNLFPLDFRQSEFRNSA